MKINTIIVDDEKEAREGLALLLNQDPQLKLSALCEDGISAIERIDALEPELLFIDIQMPEVNGFEVLKSIKKTPKAVIFVTAYDQFALKAFEVHALDYLLKPFTDHRLFEAVHRAKQQIQQHRLSNLKPLLNGIKTEEKGVLHKDDRIVIKADGVIHLLCYEDIVWIEAYDYYIKVHVKDYFYLARESMRCMQEKLPSEMFLRVHRSSIVNINYVKQAVPKPNNEYDLFLKNNVCLKVSRHYSQAFMTCLKQL